MTEQEIYQLGTEVLSLEQQANIDLGSEATLEALKVLIDHVKANS